MFKRLPGVFVIAFLLLAALAPPALAAAAEDTEAAEDAGEAAPPPDFAEICGRNEMVAEFCPDEYEQPSVFPPILYALLGIGGLIAIGLFFLYLRWLPHFAQERKEKAKARGRR